MSTVIQCCFHTSLLMVECVNVISKAIKVWYIHVLFHYWGNLVTSAEREELGALDGHPLTFIIVYKLGNPSPPLTSLGTENFSFPKLSQIRRMWRMKMTSFERLKDLDVTSVVISYVCFKNEILLIIIKEIAALSTISCHAVIPSKWFTTPCEQRPFNLPR